MMNYEKPEVIMTTELSEGVYLASGSVPAGGPNDDNQIVCQSKYMNGVWQKPTSGSPFGQTPVKEKCGCEGCSADDGDGCKILKGGELNSEGVFMPTWEQEGKKPEDLVW